jgi:CheY-like chemotaxis protein
MKPVYIVQGTHYSVPGEVVSVHSTYALAEARALKLVNVILADLHLPSASHWDAGLRRIRNSPGGKEADVSITKHVPDATGCTVIEPVKAAQHWRVLLTRDVQFTQSVAVRVHARSAEEAEAKALRISQDGLAWLDDDDSYHYGEQGAYVADPSSIEPTV